MLRSQNTAVQYISMRPILDLCKETVHMLGAWVAKRVVGIGGTVPGRSSVSGGGRRGVGGGQNRWR